MPRTERSEVRVQRGRGIFEKNSEGVRKPAVNPVVAVVFTYFNISHIFETKIFKTSCTNYELAVDCLQFGERRQNHLNIQLHY